MKKIPSLFVRDYEMDKPFDGIPVKGCFLATYEVTPGCEWVLNGEGVATRKWDGTAIMVGTDVQDEYGNIFSCTQIKQLSSIRWQVMFIIKESSELMLKMLMDFKLFNVTIDRVASLTTC